MQIFIAVWSVESYSFWIIILSFQVLLQTLNLGYIQYLGNEINLKNFNPNYPWIREGKFLIPEFFLGVIKYRIYPVLKMIN